MVGFEISFPYIDTWAIPILPPSGWLKKYNIENETLLYGSLT
jgi:hypothetical protein